MLILKIPRCLQRGIFDPNGDESICIRASNPRPKGGKCDARACSLQTDRQGLLDKNWIRVEIIGKWTEINIAGCGGRRGRGGVFRLPTVTSSAGFFISLRF